VLHRDIDPPGIHVVVPAQHNVSPYLLHPMDFTAHNESKVHEECACPPDTTSPGSTLKRNRMRCRLLSEVLPVLENIFMWSKTPGLLVRVAAPYYTLNCTKTNRPAHCLTRPIQDSKSSSPVYSVLMQKQTIPRCSMPMYIYWKGVMGLEPSGAYEKMLTNVKVRPCTDPEQMERVCYWDLIPTTSGYVEDLLGDLVYTRLSPLTEQLVRDFLGTKSCLRLSCAQFRIINESEIIKRIGQRYGQPPEFHLWTSPEPVRKVLNECLVEARTYTHDVWYHFSSKPPSPQASSGPAAAEPPTKRRRLT